MSEHPNGPVRRNGYYGKRRTYIKWQCEPDDGSPPHMLLVTGDLAGEDLIAAAGDSLRAKLCPCELGSFRARFELFRIPVGLVVPGAEEFSSLWSP